MLREALLKLHNDIAEAQTYLTAMNVKKCEIPRQEHNPSEHKCLSTSEKEPQWALVEARLEEVEATSLKLQVRNAANMHTNARLPNTTEVYRC
jgi:hypothetical protein